MPTKKILYLLRQYKKDIGHIYLVLTDFISHLLIYHLLSLYILKEQSSFDLIVIDDSFKWIY